MLSYVWAEDLEGNIGYQGHLPWQLPADLKHFKKLTINHPIVMGRKTFESLPKLLPARLHVVLTHDKSLEEKYRSNKQVRVFNNYQDLKEWLCKNEKREISIIGGSSLFKAFADQVDILHQTKINHVFQADIKMPEIDYQEFKIIKIEKHQADQKNKYDYTFIDYERKS